MNKPKNVGSKTLLSQVPKRGREYIARIMGERDGHLPLEEFLAKRWDVEGFWKSPFSSDADVAKKVEEMRIQWAQLHPEWSPDQIRTAMSLGQLTIGLREVALARRFTLENPAELARGLGVVNRLRKALHGHGPDNWCFKDFLEICAVRDIAIIQGLVEGARAGYEAFPSDWHLSDIAVMAILQKDFHTLRLVTAEMPKRKVGRWMECIYSCLTGIAEHNPDQIRQGLEEYLGVILRMRDKDELLEAINLEAQGMYRLCEWVSPDLVAGFDVTQPFPWDAEFHAWCQNHSDPMEGVDLTRVSPVLHDTVVLGKPPAWLTRPPKELYEIVLMSADPKSRKVIDSVGRLAGITGPSRHVKELIERCPVILRWNQPREYAERERKNLEEAAASVEVRVMERTPFRFY